MVSIDVRLERLQAAANQTKNGKIKVLFRDGTTQWLTPLECIDIILQFPDAVEKFESAGDGHGRLPDLLNGMTMVKRLQNGGK